MFLIKIIPVEKFSFDSTRLGLSVLLILFVLLVINPSLVVCKYGDQRNCLHYAFEDFGDRKGCRCVNDRVQSCDLKIYERTGNYALRLLNFYAFGLSSKFQITNYNSIFPHIQEKQTPNGSFKFIDLKLQYLPFNQIVDILDHVEKMKLKVDHLTLKRLDFVEVSQVQTVITRVAENAESIAIIDCFTNSTPAMLDFSKVTFNRLAALDLRGLGKVRVLLPAVIQCRSNFLEQPPNGEVVNSDSEHYPVFHLRHTEVASQQTIVYISNKHKEQFVEWTYFDFYPRILLQEHMNKVAGSYSITIRGPKYLSKEVFQDAGTISWLMIWMEGLEYIEFGTFSSDGGFLLRSIARAAKYGNGLVKGSELNIIDHFDAFQNGRCLELIFTNTYPYYPHQFEEDYACVLCVMHQYNENQKGARKLCHSIMLKPENQQNCYWTPVQPRPPEVQGWPAVETLRDQYAEKNPLCPPPGLTNPLQNPNTGGPIINTNNNNNNKNNNNNNNSSGIGGAATVAPGAGGGANGGNNSNVGGGGNGPNGGNNGSAGAGSGSGAGGDKNQPDNQPVTDQQHSYTSEDYDDIMGGPDQCICMRAEAKQKGTVVVKLHIQISIVMIKLASYRFLRVLVTQ